MGLVPDSIIKAKKAPPEIVDRLNKLETYDLSEITKNFVWKGPAYSPEQVWPLMVHFKRADLALAQSIEKEFKKFVAITLLNPGQIFAPSGPVDMYWHFLILHTREYEKFCHAVWGFTTTKDAEITNTIKKMYIQEKPTPMKIRKCQYMSTGPDGAKI